MNGQLLEHWEASGSSADEAAAPREVSGYMSVIDCSSGMTAAAQRSST